MLSAARAANTYPAPEVCCLQAGNLHRETNPVERLDATRRGRLFNGMKERVSRGRRECGGVAQASARQCEAYGETTAASLLAVIAGPPRSRILSEKHGIQSFNFRFRKDFFVGFDEQPDKHFFY
jgi:hypothetical protein